MNLPPDMNQAPNLNLVPFQPTNDKISDELSNRSLNSSISPLAASRLKPPTAPYDAPASFKQLTGIALELLEDLLIQGDFYAREHCYQDCKGHILHVDLVHCALKICIMR